ncbi:hypothetical protein [Pseudarthrobacter sp. N5]|uniref:hypothetical protein n=1 Tax=Pseudarthrobacter sp. N5 TaxID=3418416 RepID=UPI003CE6C6B2
MSLREPLKIRKALLAGTVAVALTGAGAAVVWAAGDTPTPSPSSAGPSADSGQAKVRPDKSQHSQELHSERVVKKPDGTFETQLRQKGTVESVSDSAITVKSEDGFSQNYTITADTKIVKIPAPAADGTPAKGDDGKRLLPSQATAADLHSGDSVRIAGNRNGSDVTALHILAGAVDGPGMGLGLGRGMGHSQGLGLGHGKAKDSKEQ